VSAVHRHAGHVAAVERVRVAVHEAGPLRVAQMVGWMKRLLEARINGETLREIAQGEHVTYQAVAYRESKALAALK
jgi:hypothetical protein